MKITKYLHSCLLIQNAKTTVLIDPGNYTFQEQVFPFDTIPTIDYIAITHEHQDHMDPDFIKALVEKYPHVRIIANEVIKELLVKNALVVESTASNPLSTTLLHHEEMLDFPLPINWGITVFDALFHPGDSLQFTSSPKILALPIQAPWGSMVHAARQGLAAKPQYILPIHDYHWKDDARLTFYQWLTSYFAQHNITFLQPETGIPIEI